MTPDDLAALLVQPPTQPLPPAVPKALRPVGVGDLHVVREHTIAYEGGDISHIENIIRGEHLERSTRRLDRSEASYLNENERTSEEQRDTQTTEHLSLKREIAETVRADAEVKTGIRLDAKYGTFMSISTSVDVAVGSHHESATRSATEYGKDVVSRAASKVAERVLERRSTVTIAEFEERYVHGLDNRRGTAHVSGVYQWVDRVVEAQIYNYGSRLLFDLLVPEPGTGIIVAQERARALAGVQEPKWIDVASDKINTGNYRQFAKLYGVANIDTPPERYVVVTKTLAGQANDEGRPLAEADTLAIPAGYAASVASVTCSAVATMAAGFSMQVIVGSAKATLSASTGLSRKFGLASETESLAVGVVAVGYTGYSLAIEVACERTGRAMDQWREKAYAAILQGYLVRQQEYERARKDAVGLGAAAASGRNPATNARIIRDELKRQSLERLTEQHFDSFGALELSGEGYPQVSLDPARDQEPFVRFLEHAFEWEHLSAAFYPYFWAVKDGWRHRMLLDDVDSHFADFLCAGSARVVFAARPGFEDDVVHYLETGEIWGGKGQPDIHGSDYWPIVEEIRAAYGRDDAALAVGKPWTVRLPPTLVRLRPNDDLPKWKLSPTAEWLPA